MVAGVFFILLDMALKTVPVCCKTDISAVSQNVIVQSRPTQHGLHGRCFDRPGTRSSTRTLTKSNWGRQLYRAVREVTSSQGCAHPNILQPGLQQEMAPYLRKSGMPSRPVRTHPGVFGAERRQTCSLSKYGYQHFFIQQYDVEE